MKQKIILAPSYYKNFQCTGTDCEDTCCQGWKITIDKKTYKKYKNHPELKKLMREKIVRNRHNPNDHNYAQIKFDKKTFCGFLNDNHLCSIQLNYGEDYLCNTCAMYPRTLNLVNNQFELSLSLSCPEVARLVLLNQDKMAFDNTKGDIGCRILINKHFNEEKTTLKEEKYFWKLRIFTIDLLQCEKFKLGERMVILGLAFNKIQQHIDHHEFSEIPNTIKTYQGMIKEGLLKDSLEKMSLQTTLQMKLIKELGDERIFRGVNNASFLECYADFIEGIVYDEDSTVEEIGERYRTAYQSYYHPFMKSREYMMENYLVNYVFRQLFPLHAEGRFFDGYVTMVMHYALIKMILIGMAGFHKEKFNEDHIVKLIYAYSRVVEHNATFIKHVEDLIKKNNMDNMAYMAILIKN